MLECLIIGDSIAVGVSQVRFECAAYAKSGINSSNWNKMYSDKIEPAKTVVISLGTNDVEKADTKSHLLYLRSKVQASRVFWILPNERIKEKARNDVIDVAKQFNDFMIERPKDRMSKDDIHPTYLGYKELARQTK